MQKLEIIKACLEGSLIFDFQGVEDLLRKRAGPRLAF